jgi:hypothetical protein
MYFGLSGTLMASNGPGIFAKEVFHQKKCHENNREMRGHTRAKIGPTT